MIVKDEKLSAAISVYRFPVATENRKPEPKTDSRKKIFATETGNRKPIQGKKNLQPKPETETDFPKPKPKTGNRNQIQRNKTIRLD